jgi:hypothetical protein
VAAHAVRENSGHYQDPLTATDLIPIEVKSIIDVLAGFVDNRYVTGWLSAVVDDRCLPIGLRIEALRGLGRADDPDAALARIKAMADQLDSLDLLQAAQTVTALDPGARLGRELLNRCCVVTGEDLVRASAAADLAALGETECAGRTAREVVLADRLPFDLLRSAAETWLTTLPATGDARPQAVRALLDETPGSVKRRAVLAESLAKLGHLDAARDLARELLEAPQHLDQDIRSVLASCANADAIDLDGLVEALGDATDLAVAAQAVRGLADAGCVEHATRLARIVIADVRVSGFELGQAAIGWLAAAGEPALCAVLEAIRARGVPTITWFGNLITGLAEGGFPAAATALAAEDLAAIRSDPWELGGSVRAWLAVGGPQEASKIVAALHRRGPLSARPAARVAEAFALQGCPEQAVQFAEITLGGSADIPFDLVPALKALVLAQGRPGVARALAAVETGQWRSIQRIALAEHIASAGYLDAAHELWCSVLTRRIAPLDWVAVAAGRLVATGGLAAATAALTAMGGTAATLRLGVVEALAAAATAACAPEEPAVPPVAQSAS